MNHPIANTGENKSSLLRRANESLGELVDSFSLTANTPQGLNDEIALYKATLARLTSFLEGIDNDGTPASQGKQLIFIQEIQKAIVGLSGVVEKHTSLADKQMQILAASVNIENKAAARLLKTVMGIIEKYRAQIAEVIYSNILEDLAEVHDTFTDHTANRVVLKVRD